MDQMLEGFATQTNYCFLDGYSSLNQIGVDHADHKKTTFTCPFWVFAYQRMPFRLCNAPATFQMRVLPIFSDVIENSIDLFMDDLSVFDDSFDCCLDWLDDVLKRDVSR